VRSQKEPSALSREARSRRGVWYFQGQQEHRDLLPLGASIDAFLAMLGRRTPPQYPPDRTQRRGAGLEFSFAERGRALEVG